MGPAVPNHGERGTPSRNFQPLLSPPSRPPLLTRRKSCRKPTPCTPRATATTGPWLHERRSRPRDRPDEGDRHRGDPQRRKTCRSLHRRVTTARATGQLLAPTWSPPSSQVREGAAGTGRVIAGEG